MSLYSTVIITSTSPEPWLAPPLSPAVIVRHRESLAASEIQLSNVIQNSKNGGLNWDGIKLIQSYTNHYHKFSSHIFNSTTVSVSRCKSKMNV